MKLDKNIYNDFCNRSTISRSTLGLYNGPLKRNKSMELDNNNVKGISFWEFLKSLYFDRIKKQENIARKMFS